MPIRSVRTVERCQRVLNSTTLYSRYPYRKADLQKQNTSLSTSGKTRTFSRTPWILKAILTIHSRKGSLQSIPWRLQSGKEHFSKRSIKVYWIQNVYHISPRKPSSTTCRQQYRKLLLHCLPHRQGAKHLLLKLRYTCWTRGCSTFRTFIS